MLGTQLIAIGLYIAILLGIGIASYRAIRNANDFILGSRGLNFYMTAFAAHASDMSGWIFLAYPPLIYSQGLIGAWVALGLTFFMFLNWQFVAPRLRLMTEKYNSLTISSFLESRLNDTTGTIRIFTAAITLFFYTIYISAGLVALGLLIQSVFSIPYAFAILAGILVVVPYLFFGGYITLAWTDLFQGIFLLAVILFVPLYALGQVGWFGPIVHAFETSSHLKGFFPGANATAWVAAVFSFCGWGLGYFGQPHIITKFMGIRNPAEIPKSKYIGTGWQILALGGSTLIGLVGIVYFPDGLKDTQLLFVNICNDLFPTFISTIIICAILGATVTVMDSQILIVVSNITEDFYKKIVRKTAKSNELLIVSRVSIFFVAAIAYVIALANHTTIYGLISYAWYGLGASFGPIIIYSLFSKRVNKYGAWAGLLSGSVLAAVWPLVNDWFEISVPTLIPGFVVGFFSIWIVSLITASKSKEKEIEMEL
ncbi:MAG: High-affinity proline transporter PutP [Chlamydiia bacterium]|nr:High-affinity proline transporter PutP [Chlamydiia bacterium]